MKYPTNWKQIRKVIINMDDHVCRMCFCGASDKAFHVHHMDYRKSNNLCTNLVTLCSSCHSQIHNNNYKPLDHDDWPTPWTIERPSEEEFDLLLQITEPRKQHNPRKYNEDYPWDFISHKPK